MLEDRLEPADWDTSAESERRDVSRLEPVVQNTSAELSKILTDGVEIGITESWLESSLRCVLMCP